MIYNNKNMWRHVVGLGLLWLMVGMVVMPAGAALNPSKLFQVTLIVLLYLPAFGLALAGRAAFWRGLLGVGMFRVLLMLLGWAAITLLWSPVNHPGEELARLASILTFVLAWQVWVRADDQRALQLLWLAGVAIALAVACYLVLYLLQPPKDGRIVGEGVIATANYAAAVMGVSLLWLYQLTDATRVKTLVRVCGLAALLVFIGLTQTRSVWLALALAFTIWLGPIGLVFFLLQGVFAAGSLEIINYIEHYGLERQRLADGRYERTTHRHSWNSDYALSNLMLFQLQRHSDHHAFPKRRYAILRHHPDAPQLPGGYSAMFVLAMFPPLWRRVIDPRVHAWRAAGADAGMDREVSGQEAAA